MIFMFITSHFVHTKHLFLLWTWTQHCDISPAAKSLTGIGWCPCCWLWVTWHPAGHRSALLCGFGEGAQLFGVDVLQLLQLSLSSSVQVLDVHHVRLLDASVLSELVTDSGDEARFVVAGPQELPVQSQDLFLQLTVARHPTNSTSPDQRSFFKTREIRNQDHSWQHVDTSTECLQLDVH